MNRNTYLNIDGTLIYDIDVQTIDLNFYLKDIREFNTKKTSFSKPITIFKNYSTNKFFTGLFNINAVNGFDISQRYNCQLIQDNIIILSGYLYLDKVTRDSYEVVLAKGDVDIFTLAGDKLISDLQFQNGLYQHTLTKSHISAQWNKTAVNMAALTGGTDLAYPIIDYNNVINSIGDFSQDYPILPAVGAREIFDKILNDNGYTYSASTTVLNLLNQLRIPFNGTLDTFLSSNYYNFYSGSTTVNVLSRTTKAYPLAQVHLRNMTYVDNYIRPNEYLNLIKYSASGDYNNYDNYIAANGWTAPMTQTYKFVFKVYGIDGDHSPSLTITPALATWNSRVYGDLLPKDNDIIYKFSEITIPQNNSGVFTTELDIIVTKNTKLRPILYTEAGNNVSIFTGSTNTSQYRTDLTIYQYDYLYQNQSIDINDVLPQNYKQQDFINDVIKSFNLYIQTDNININLLHIKTFNEFYDNYNVVDWSNKVESDSLYFQDINLTLPNLYNFNFSDDSDIYNKDYNDKFTTNLNSLTVTNPKSLAAVNANDYILSIPSTALINIDNNTYIPRICDKDGKRDWKPRLLFLNFQSQTGSTYLFTKYTNYNYPVNNIMTVTSYQKTDVSDPTNLSLSFDSNQKTYLNRSTTLSNLNLYNKFYKQDIESKMFGNQKLLIGNLRLKPADLQGNIFSNLIFVSDQRIGDAYYYLNAIKSYNSADELVEVELIKIDTSYIVSYPSTITPTILALSTENQNNLNNVVNSSSSNSNSNNTNISLEYSNIKNKPWFDVKDFGAKGDGTTDDVLTIQSAINTCNAAGGGIVFFPEGNYKLSKGLIGYGNISFQGCGREVTKLSTVNFGAGETFGTGGTTSKMLYFVDANNVTINDLWLQGVSIDGSSSQGIWFDLLNEGNCENIVINNVLVTDHASNSAIFIDTPILSTLNNVKVLRVAGNCIKMTGGTSVTINECYAITCTEAGFLMNTMTYCTFNSCASEVCGVSFDFISCSAIVCNGCGVEGAINRNDANDKYKYGENGYGTFKTAYPGISYRSTNSKVQLNSCYSRDPMLKHTEGYFDKINCREFTLYPTGVNIDYSANTRQNTQGTNTTLASAINNSQTNITVAAGTGSYFGTSDFWIIVYPSNFNSAFAAYASTDQTYGGAAELMRVASRSGDVLTVDARGQGTFWNRFEALAFSGGSKVDHANQYFYAVSFVNNLGQETRLSDYPWRGYRSLALQIVKDIPISTNTNIVARNIYRTKSGSEHGMFYKIHTISDNTTTEWIDNVVESTGQTIAAHPEPSPHVFTTVASSSNITVDTNRFAVNDIVKADYDDYLPYPFSISASRKYKVLSVAGNVITVSLSTDATNTPIVVSSTRDASYNLYMSKYDMPGESDGIENNTINYINNINTTIPIASTTVLGGVKQGTNITIDSSGVISATGGGSGTTYNSTTDLIAKKITSYENLKIQCSGIQQIVLNSNSASYGNIQNDTGNTWSLGYNSTDTTALGTPVLTWKNNCRVGINNINPGYSLDVCGNINLTGNYYRNGVVFSGSSSSSGGTTLNGYGYVKASGTTITYDNSTFAAQNGSASQNFSAFDLTVCEDQYLTGQLFQSHHNGKASYRGNWTHAGYWGMGATDANNIVQLGHTDEAGTFNSGAFFLEIPNASNGIILASPDGTRYKLTVANGGTLAITAV